MDEIFADCADDDYQGHGLELEVYKFDYANRNWNGPYLFWSSELYETSKKWSNVKAGDFKAKQTTNHRLCVIVYAKKNIFHIPFIELFRLAIDNKYKKIPSESFLLV